MALTQTAAIPVPSWDEEVVPALRKRLENESRTLAKRISAVSISSLEEIHRLSANETSSYKPSNNPNGEYKQSRPSTSSRTPSDRGTNSSSSSTLSHKPPTTRSRTYSQPFSPNNQYTTNGKASSKDSLHSTNSRATSPRINDTKPTRIPKPTRSRAGSISNASYNANGNNPYKLQSPTQGFQKSHSDLWIVQERLGASSSQSSVSVTTSPKGSGIIEQQPPFQPSSYENSWQGHSDNEAPPRQSTESEEQPYEHWYRGEISRNGGVGELRVAKRMEMLQIANYGHALPSPSRTMESDPPANAITEAINQRLRQRKRADSLGRGELQRSSFYMDDEGARAVNRVMDEDPLTDIETEASDHVDAEEYANEDDTITMNVADLSTASAPLPTTRSTTPTPSMIARPSSRQTTVTQATSRQSSEPPRNTTPTPIQRGKSEPPSFPSSASASSPPNRVAKQQQRPIPGSMTRRGASTLPLSGSKKTNRTEASQATRAKLEAARKQAEKDRRSVAQYTVPDDMENMEDAIPTWSQPIPKDGNWDNVILPAVAKKKGLEQHYEMMDGSPRPRKEEPVIEPAPGTFGWDHSKYRPPYMNGNAAGTDEFGQKNTITDEGDEEKKQFQSVVQPQATPPPAARGPATFRPAPPASPVPFAHYMTPGDSTLPPIAQIEPLQHEPEDPGAGCCKCVVM